jgi:pseudouridine synthase
VVQKESQGVQITLYEGRNRQIRKMMAALDFRVVKLHRQAFGGIQLHPLAGPGSWAQLDQDELRIIHNILTHPEEDSGYDDE